MERNEPVGSICDNVLIRAPARVPHVYHVPEGVTDLHVHAFDHVTGIREIHLPASLVHLAGLALSMLEGLQTVVFHGENVEIGDGAFRGCPNLRRVFFRHGVRSLGKEAFADCRMLEEIGPLTGLKTLGAGCFLRCRALKAVELPEGVTELPENGFRDCSSLEVLHLPASLKVVQHGALMHCSSLHVSDGLFDRIREIGPFALNGCPLPEVLRLPALESLGNCALAGRNLRRLDCPRLSEIQRGSLFGCVSLEEVHLGHVDSIDDGAFQHMEQLKRVTASSIAKIGYRAFSRCGMLEHVETESVLIVMNEAFHHCQALDVQEILSVSQHILYGAFDHCQTDRLHLTDQWIANAKDLLLTYPREDMENSGMDEPLQLPEGLTVIRTGQVLVEPAAPLLRLLLETDTGLTVTFHGCSVLQILRQLEHTELLLQPQGAEMCRMLKLRDLTEDDPEEVVYQGFLQLAGLPARMAEKDVQWLIERGTAKRRVEDVAFVLRGMHEPVKAAGWMLSLIWEMEETGRWTVRVEAKPEQEKNVSEPG